LAAFNGLAAPDGLARSGWVNPDEDQQKLQRMNAHTESTGNDNDMGTLVEGARALLAAAADMAGKKVEKARKRLVAALASAKEIKGCGCENAVEISAISKGGRLGTNPTQSRLIDWGPFVTGCNWSRRSGWSFGRGHDESESMKSQLG